MEKCLIIGIAGGTGSGKTTFTNRIKKEFGENVSVLYHDSYYKAQDELTLEQRKVTNYDHPNQLDTDLLISHLKKLKNGEKINEPVYDFMAHTRAHITQTVFPAKIILVEGILVFSDINLRELFDIKIFVETDADERILRRVQRDVKERGRTIDEIIDQYLSTVKPMHNLYVEPTKYYADVIINGGENDVAFDLIKCKIKEKIR